jgi:hypothetical protein
MPATIAPEAYAEKKDDILTRCLRITEDIYSNIKTPEALEDLFDRRMETIDELRMLDESAGEAKDVCPKETIDRLDAKLKLILSLDERIESAMRDAMRDLRGSMKRNTMGQKFIKYANAAISEKGRLLDEKK